MAGLSLGFGGGVRASAASAGYSSAAQPATASEAAYGSMSGSAAAPGGARALLPTNPAGIALWSGIAGLAALALIRHSLPR